MCLPDRKGSSSFPTIFQGAMLNFEGVESENHPKLGRILWTIQPPFYVVVLFAKVFEEYSFCPPKSPASPKFWVDQLILLLARSDSSGEGLGEMGSGKVASCANVEPSRKVEWGKVWTNMLTNWMAEKSPAIWNFWKSIAERLEWL